MQCTFRNGETFQTVDAALRGTHASYLYWPLNSCDDESSVLRKAADCTEQLAGAPFCRNEHRSLVNKKRKNGFFVIRVRGPQQPIGNRDHRAADYANGAIGRKGSLARKTVCPLARNLPCPTQIREKGGIKERARLLRGFKAKMNELRLGRCVCHRSNYSDLGSFQFRSSFVPLELLPLRQRDEDSFLYVFLARFF